MNSSSTILLTARLVSLAVFGWNVLLFSRAIRHHFTQPEGVPLLMRWLVSCGGMAIVVNGGLLVLVEVRLPWAAAGFVLLVASQLVFRAAVWATAAHKLSLAFSSDVPTRLNQSGIYRRVRHPFYLAYTLTWLAVVVGTLHPGALLMLIVMLGFYLTAARREEKKFLGSPLAAAYRDYQGQAGMFLPSPPFNPANSIKPTK